MPRPAAATMPTVRAVDEPAPAPAVAPAPDADLDYVTASRTRRTGRARPAAEHVRNYPQLGTRIRPDLYELLVRVCDERDLRQSRVVTRGIELALAELGFEVERR